ncbi:MAG: MgtC/SapB family protein [Patescibacteria group bacterium]
MYTEELALLIPIVYAIILGGLIGWQREKQGKWAGPRTHALVAGGSALFTLLSVTAFGPNNAPVAAGIVTGIGFLGAGTILRKEDRVEGLTTAAGLWMAAAIGMASGLQFYILSIATSVLVLLLLMFDDSKFKKSVPEKIKNKKIR